MEGESILEPRGLKPSSSERMGSAVWHLDFPSVTLESNSSFASSSTSSESSSSPRSGRTDHSSDPTAASLDCHGKRKVVLPDSEDTELELASELEISRTSHDCNLSALQLTNLPDGLPIQTLVVLRLSDNGLTFLPEDVFCREHCPHLRELDVNSNQLVDIPETLLFLPSLEVLQLNHNYLRDIPFPPLDDPEVPVEEILPKLRRVGLDWNQLERFPVEFFLVCADIQDVFLGQNSSMLDDPIPFDLLMDSPAAWAYEDGEVGRRVHVTLDNRPRLVSQVAEEDWAERAPWLMVDFHKIYPDRVLDFLFLGSLRTAQTMSVYHDLDITHLLTVGRNLEVRTEEGMQHLVLPLNDFPEEDLGSCFKEAFDFIDAARHEGSKVLVHCFAGLSRSASIAVAYLMYAEHQCLEEALATVRSARPAAQPNEGFMRCLESYDAKLRNMRQAQSTVVDAEPNDYVI